MSRSGASRISEAESESEARASQVRFESCQTFEVGRE